MKGVNRTLYAEYFEFFLPTKLVFGKGKISQLGQICAGHGKKPLIVTGKSAAKTGLLDRIVEQFSESAVFDGVIQNPMTTTAEAGLAVLRAEKCDMIVAAGGGSALDTGKAIAFMAKTGGDINDYIMLRKSGGGALPVFAVPTTAGTGSEANCFAVLTNPETNEKKSLKHPSIFPKAAILDPELLTTQPRHTIASTGFDAMAHNIEAYIANRCQPIVRALAAQGISLIFEHLENVFNDPTDVDAFEHVMLASTLGGMSISMAGVGLPHAMEHPVSGLYNIVHGNGLAAIMPAVLRMNTKRAPQRQAELADILGFGIGFSDEAAKSAAFCEAVDDLLGRLKLNTTLSCLGVKHEDIGWLSNNAGMMMYSNAINNPYIPVQDDIHELFEVCM